jgi:catechol 2,3-dioxygenase-like lactoylglutathione lyase family enzyme
MSDLTATSIHHLSLSVGDAVETAGWFQQLLGGALVTERMGDGFRRLRLAWPSGLVLSITQHDQTDLSDRFDHRRIGMDHFSLACSSKAEITDWCAHMDERGIEHGPLEDVAYGWAVTARTPDGIPVEFFCAK